VQLKFLTDGELRMHVSANGSNGSNGSNGTNRDDGPHGSRVNGSMTLMEAAFLIERLQRRAAHGGEVEALKIARDAILTIVAEGYQTLGDRLRRPVNGTSVD